MGYIRGLVHGVVVGTAIGVCVAPQQGARTRAQVRETVEGVRRGVRRAEETARRVMPEARDRAGSVVVVLQGLRHTVGRRRRHDGVEVGGSPVADGDGDYR
jgi:hypothetical protein